MSDTPVKARVLLAHAGLQAAERVAVRLRDLGVDVERVRPNAITITASRDTFEGVFRCRLAAEGGKLVARGGPNVPDELREEIASVYVPSRPTFF